MEQIGSEYNFNTGGSIKALNDLIVKVEQLDKQVNKVATDTKTAGDGIAKLPTKTTKAASGFDALGNSINQVTREFPAFAFSAQTGFLAVSNNIPILIDSINQLKVANAALTAEGKASIPIWKQVVSSLFSWQTALSLAISFSVMYGKEIGNFISNLFSGKDAIDKATLSLTNYNKALKETNYKQSISDISQLRVNISLYKDGLLTQKEVVDSFNESLGKSSEKIKGVAEAEDFLVKKGPAFIRMTFLKTAALTAQSDASRAYVDEQILLAKREETLATNKIAIERETQNIIANGERMALKGVKKTQEEKAEFEIKTRSLVQRRYTKEYDQQIIDLDNQNKILLQISDNAFKEAAKIAKGYDLSLFGNGSEDAKKKKEAIKNILTEFELLKAEFDSLNLKISNGVLSGADIKADTDRLDVVILKLKMVKDALDLINGTTLEEALKQMEDFGKEANSQGEKDLKQRRDNEKKAIEDGLMAIEMEYAKKKEEKVLNTKEELELERGKQLAMISFLNQFATMDEKIQKEIFERKIKLSEQNSKINKNNKEEHLKSLQDEYKGDDAFMKKTIDNELDKIDEKYVKIKNGKILSDDEQLQLDLSKTQEELGYLELVKDAGEKYSDDYIKLKERESDLLTKIGEKNARKSIELEREVRDAFISISETVSGDYFKTRKEAARSVADMEIESLEEQRQMRTITEGEFIQKRKEARNNEAKTQRELDLAQVKINTAIAIAKTFAVYGGTPKAFIAAGLVAVEGLIQYGMISSQPLPQFAKGTDMVSGGVRGKDSVHALLMPQEAVIPTKENLARPGLAKAWIDGNLDRHLMMNYVKPAIDENNRRWEATLKVNQSSTFIRNDNFSDKNIVKQLAKSNRINQRLINNLVDGKSPKRNSRLWN
jgi:hypothetical protein